MIFFNRFDKGFIPNGACTKYNCTIFDENFDPIMVTDFLEVCQEGEVEESAVDEDPVNEEADATEVMEASSSAGFGLGFRALISVMLFAEAVLL